MSKSRTYEHDSRLKIWGSTYEIEVAAELIERFFPDLSGMTEPEARICLQSLLDTEPLHAEFTFDGNGVYSKNKIIKDINRVKKNGMDKMTNRLYEFLHLCCGSIAHYNKQGWIDEYPTIDRLREFFKSNEFGNRVLDDIPTWKTDVKEIVTEIENILCI